MPSVVGQSIWEITDHQLLQDTEVTNVYHYRVVPPAPIPTPAEVAIAWEAAVGNTLATIQSLVLVHTELEVEELNSLTNFATFTSGVGAGGRAGEILAHSSAWEVVKRRSSKEVRDGRTRIAGIVESDAAGNFITVAVRVPNYDPVVAAFNTDLTITGGAMEMVILRKARDPVTKEQLPYSSWTYSEVSVVNTQWRITTQNSRKPWS